MLGLLRARQPRRRAALRPVHLRPSRDVLSVESEGVSVLLDLRRDVYFTLDEVGTLVWQQIERGCTVEDTVQRICDEYDVAVSDVRGDVERFMVELLDRGLAVHA